MAEFDFPTKLIKFTKMTMRRVKCRENVNSDLSEVFYTEQGLRQGNYLACILFNVALEKAVGDSNVSTRYYF